MDFGSFLVNNFSVVLVFCVTLLIVYLNTRRRPGVPPGPPCWPAIGNISSIAGGNMLENLQGLRQKYGDIFAVYFGSELNIVLSGFDVIHEALVKRGSLFSFRPVSLTKDVQKVPGVVMGNGEPWKELRSFTLNTLKNICYRKTGVTLEHRVQKETDILIQTFLNKAGDFEVSSLITLSLTNVMHGIIHGKRIGYENKRFLWFVHMLDNSFKSHLIQRILQKCLPWLRYLPGDLLRKGVLEKQRQQMLEYISDMSAPNFESYQPGDEDSFIDHWISAYQGKERCQESSFHSVYGDLMAAGSETSATTLKWIILALVQNPEIQEKLQVQVDSVLKKNQTPSISDRANLPYVEATVLEGLRFGTPLPLAVPHTVLQDIKFRGYLIPKDSTILPNIASVHYDPNIFRDPDVFQPERFLNEDQTKIVGTEKLIPFSLGPRSCLGETLARVELFLYLVTLAQQVEFHAPESEKLPSMKGEAALTYRPKPYKVRVSARKR